MISVYLLSLTKQPLALPGTSSPWLFLLCVCFQVTHVFWKSFCLGLISSSFTALSLSLSFFICLFLPSLRARTLKPSQVWWYLGSCYSPRSNAHVFSTDRSKYASEKQKESSDLQICLFGSPSSCLIDNCLVISSIFFSQRGFLMIFAVFPWITSRHVCLRCFPPRFTSVHNQ